MNRLLLSLFAGLLLYARPCHGQTVLSSQDAVSYALAHRPELRAANNRVSSTDRLSSQAGLSTNPRVLVRKEDLRTQTSPFGENSQRYWEGEQLLETSGKRGGRIAVAQQGTEESRLQADLARRQIVLNVRESYWKAKAAQSLAALYAQDADYFRRVIEYHEARFREGKIAEVDLLRVRLQGEQIRAAAANARLDSEKALLTLAQEMNAAANSAWVLSEDFETLEDPRPVPGGAKAESLRTERQLAQQAIAKAEGRPRLEKANGRPHQPLRADIRTTWRAQAP